jgi:hypothetical protein
MHFSELRDKYPRFIYNSYEVTEDDKDLIMTFNFQIENLSTFHPVTKIPKDFIINKNININLRNSLIFHIGLIEMISYYKCTCSKEIIIKAGFLNKDQIIFIKKLLYYGLGEFLYVNNIDISEDDLVNFIIDCKEKQIEIPSYIGQGNLVLLGGGKDSNVTLEILKDEDNSIVIQNPKLVQINCALVAGYKEEDIVKIKRTIDPKLLELNKQGFLNGHTPFSSLLAFETYLVGYLMNKRYIVLSNEESANEGTVIGTKINHQYSKSYEFENDFNNYTKKYFKIDLNYFSFLRPLTEYQIALLFSKYKKYHQVFKSCNVGSKDTTWKWCCNCPKCLFVYIILSPFLSDNELIDIFGEDLFNKAELLPIFKEIIGETGVKPFECVGSYEEARYAISKRIIQMDGDLPILLRYYKDNYKVDTSLDFEHMYNKNNNLNPYFENLLKKELEKYVL